MDEQASRCSSYQINWIPRVTEYHTYDVIGKDSKGNCKKNHEVRIYINLICNCSIFPCSFPYLLNVSNPSHLAMTVLHMYNVYMIYVPVCNGARIKWLIHDP